ncbi:MAG: 4-hydroxy-tetrahydrodipicolinate reductase [Micrococcaceae bacterium]
MEIQVTMIKVAVIGANGKMGSETIKAISETDDLKVVAKLDSDSNLEEMLVADVMVDFTHPEASEKNVRYAVEHGVHCVVGSSGWNQDKQDELASLLEKYSETNVFIAPNFALGAVLAMSFAAKAAKFFDSVEVIEMHHPQKVDAPSGTAVSTAEAIAKARKVANCAAIPDATVNDGKARGADIDGVKVHAVRLQGLVAHQEVLLGNSGEQLVLRHDSFDRKSFMPGVVLAVREVQKHQGLTVGLDKLMGI